MICQGNPTASGTGAVMIIWVLLPMHSHSSCKRFLYPKFPLSDPQALDLSNRLRCCNTGSLADLKTQLTCRSHTYWVIPSVPPVKIFLFVSRLYTHWLGTTKSDLLFLTLFYFVEFFMQNFWVYCLEPPFFFCFWRQNTLLLFFFYFKSFLSMSFQLDTEDTGDLQTVYLNLFCSIYSDPWRISTFDW